MEDPHQVSQCQAADDFATYSPAESPSSLNSSFDPEGGLLFMPPASLPPKRSPRYRGKPPTIQKQWPPRGFKAPTLLTADPTDEHGDSTSPETDWLSPASRGSDLNEYADPPTSRWSVRPLEGGWRDTSPRGGRISPKTKKLMERFGQLSQVREGSILGTEEEGLQRKWQKVSQEEQARRMCQILGGEDGQAFEQPGRQELKQYRRPVESRWYSLEEEVQSEEQRIAEESRQQRWQELKQQEVQKQQQLRSRQLAASDSPREAAPVRMVKRECWAKVDGDSTLVKKDCWVEETVPLDAEMQQSPQQGQLSPETPAQRRRQPHHRRRADSWHDEAQHPAGPSGTEYQGAPAGSEGFQQTSKSWSRQRVNADRHYDSACELVSEEHWNTRQGFPRSMANATFPRSEQEQADWEARGWRREEFKGGTRQLAMGADEQVFQQNLRASIAERWKAQTSRESQEKKSRSKGTSPKSAASIEEHASKVGYVAKDEQIWVEESRISLEAHMRGKQEATAVSNESSPTRVAEAVDRLALMSLGWDEAMHNFHDLRGVKAVVKKPEDLLSPAPVGGGVTLSGLAKKRSNSMPTKEVQDLKTPLAEEKQINSLRRTTSDTEAEVVARTESSAAPTRQAPPPAHSLPLSVAAIICPPALPDCPDSPILRGDSYTPQGMTHPTWSTPVTPVPLLSTPKQMEPPPLQRRASLDSERGSQTLLPHPPAQASSHLPPRRGSRGLLSPEHKRSPLPAPSPPPRAYDSSPTSFRRPSRLESHSETEGLPRSRDGCTESRFVSQGRAAQENLVAGGGAPLVVEQDCPICHEPLGLGRAMFAPECGHFVHFDCCRSNLLKGALDCPRCHLKMQAKPYLKTPYSVAPQNHPPRPVSASRSAR